MQPNSDGSSSRRRFLETSVAASVAWAAAAPLSNAAPDPNAAPGPAVPLVTLGRTGRKVTKLGMGTSWELSPSFVQAALLAGVRYIDTSETYENTLAERILGQVIERTGLRKDVYLVTKNASYRKASGPGFSKVLETRLTASLQRLRTDYVDAYYFHGLSSDQIGLLRDPDVKAAFEALKKAGKIQFVGLSCHDARLPEILTTAAEVGWVDQVMFKFNFRDLGGRDRYDDLNRAIDKAAKANLGLVAMKTQGGAINFPDKMAALQAKGLEKEVAAIKTVWMDGRVHVAVSEMTNRDDLRKNVAASREELTPKEASLLEKYRCETARSYCHGCGQFCEPAAGKLAVADTMRFLRYHLVQGKIRQARELYQLLPFEARDLSQVDLQAVQRACPHGLPVVELLRRAESELG